MVKTLAKFQHLFTRREEKIDKILSYRTSLNANQFLIETLLFVGFFFSNNCERLLLSPFFCEIFFLVKSLKLFFCFTLSLVSFFPRRCWAFSYIYKLTIPLYFVYYSDRIRSSSSVALYST